MDLDLAGQVLFIAGIGALTYALIEGPHSGWASPMIIGLFVGAVVLIVSFVLVELRSHEPMMDVRLFSDRVYDVAILTLFVVLFCIYGMMLITTQYLQNVRDYEPAQAGIVLGVYTLPVMIPRRSPGRSSCGPAVAARSSGAVLADCWSPHPRRRHRRLYRLRGGRPVVHRRRRGARVDADHQRGDGGGAT